MQGGLTHRSGLINESKWAEAVSAWLEFDLDIILFSELQPNPQTDEPPRGPYSLDYRPEPVRRPGCGAGASFLQQIGDACTRLELDGAPSQPGFWLLRAAGKDVLICLWYVPIYRNGSHTAAECKTFWLRQAAALWQARSKYPDASVLAGGDANVILKSLHAKP